MYPAGMCPVSRRCLTYEVSKMLKKILLRSAISAPVSIVVNQLITIIISLVIGDGRYFPVTPAFAAMFESELAPVLVQMLLIGLIGATFAGSSAIFEIDRWSFLKQGVIHLAITSAVFITVALICWRPVNLAGVITLTGIMVFIYGCTWLSRYLIWRRCIRKLNARIQSINREN